MGCRASKPIRRFPPTMKEIMNDGMVATKDGQKLCAYSKYGDEAKAGGGESKGASAYVTWDRTKENPIHYSETGTACKKFNPATTLPKLFQECVKRHGDKTVMCQEDTTKIAWSKGQPVPAASPGDQWANQWTMKEYYEECCSAARAFVAAGMDKFDAVNIWGFNSPEWIMAEMAGILGGGCAAGIYPTDTKEQVLYKVKHSGASVVCVENKQKAEILAGMAGDLPKLKLIVVWGLLDKIADNDVRSVGDGDRKLTVCTWKYLTQKAEKCSTDDLNKRMDFQKPGHCCAYIYTSGTTGRPKAVMITHDNIIFEACNASLLMGNIGSNAEEERILSYLPLSHVAGMMVDVICPLCICSGGSTGNSAESSAGKQGWVCVYFARQYDLKAGSIGDRLRAVRPTLFLGVPRVWEKVAEKLKAVAAQNPMTGIKLKIKDWAKRKGLEHQQNCQLGGSGEYACCYGIAEKKVFQMVKSKLGLDACKFGFTGAAPITIDTLEFFGQLGIQINEVYGMSECTGATTWSTDEAHEWGACGWPMPSCEVKILIEEEDGSYSEAKKWNSKSGKKPTEAEQGEICYRGRHIMAGYMANPDLGDDHVKEIQGKNESAIDKNGWLHSGDKGCMSLTGMIRITGRYKELIIGAGGENIAPVPIEDNVKKLCPAISNIMMVGDKRKYNVAVVTLKAEGATGELPGGDDLLAVAQLQGIKQVSAAMKSTAFTDEIWAAIEKSNKDQNCCTNNASKIQKFTILTRDFSVQTEELTPTLKLKRSVVNNMHKDFLDSMYEVKDPNQRYVEFTGTMPAVDAGESKRGGVSAADVKTDT